MHTPADDASRSSRRFALDSRHPTPGALAWLVIVVLVGVVQIVRRQWGDVALFGGVAVLIGVVATGGFDGLRRLPVIRTVIVIAVAVVPAVALVFLPRHLGPTAAVVAAMGVCAVFAALVGRVDAAARPWPRDLAVLAWSWALIWVAGCLWELLQFVLGGILPGGRSAYPAASDLLDPVVATGIGQAVFVTAWVAAGVFLVQRGRQR